MHPTQPRLPLTATNHAVARRTGKPSVPINILARCIFEHTRSYGIRARKRIPVPCAQLEGLACVPRSKCPCKFFLILPSSSHFFSYSLSVHIARSRLLFSAAQRLALTRSSISHQPHRTRPNFWIPPRLSALAVLVPSLIPARRALFLLSYVPRFHLGIRT
jgi:hypothetical protein